MKARLCVKHCCCFRGAPCKITSFVRDLWMQPHLADAPPAKAGKNVRDGCLGPCRKNLQLKLLEEQKRVFPGND